MPKGYLEFNRQDYSNYLILKPLPALILHFTFIFLKINRSLLILLYRPARRIVVAAVHKLAQENTLVLLGFPAVAV